MAFPSVYEMFAPLTTVRKQHFWEYFSGATLNSRWTLNGTNDAGMKNTAGGGYYIEPPSGANTIMYFNNIRPFAHNGSVCIAVVGGNLVGSRVDVQVGLASASEFSGVEDKAVYAHDSGVGLIMNTADGTTESEVSSTSGGSLTDDSWNTIKIETKSSSVEYIWNGVADGTLTTNLPDTSLQPAMEVRSVASAGADYGKIKYMECYNT